MGESASAAGLRAVAMGPFANAAGFYAICIGDQTLIEGDPPSGAVGNWSIAIGPNAYAAQYGLALGYHAEASGNYSIGIGERADATALQSVGIGRQVDALAENSIALGYVATVPVTSPRSMAIGANSSVPADTSDRAVLKTNELDIVRSNGTGATRIALYSPNGTKYWLSVSDAGALVITAA